MVTLSRNTALRCDVPPNTALRVRERIRPLYRESLGEFANPSGGQSLPSRGGWNSNQTLDSRPSSRDFNNADTAASRISYVWGPDLGSGTDGHTSLQKAGGVRGLLAVLGTTDNLKQFPLMDRLGNVTGYKKASVSPGPAVLDAVIEYDAFGREVRSTGPASDTMPYRFSTKYTDPESGLVYYGYRFYDPDRGRWVNRDPIGVSWGTKEINQYAFVLNKPSNNWDVLGLYIDGNGNEQVGPPAPIPGGGSQRPGPYPDSNCVGHACGSGKQENNWDDVKKSYNCTKIDCAKNEQGGFDCGKKPCKEGQHQIILYGDRNDPQRIYDHVESQQDNGQYTSQDGSGAGGVGGPIFDNIVNPTDHWIDYWNRRGLTKPKQPYKECYCCDKALPAAK